MKTELKSLNQFYNVVCNDSLVFIFGAGISNALTGERFGWYKWIADGISGIRDKVKAAQLKTELDADLSASNLISVIGKVIKITKADGSYAAWMHQSFEAAQISNEALMQTLRKLTQFNDILLRRIMIYYSNKLQA